MTESQPEQTTEYAAVTDPAAADVKVGKTSLVARFWWVPASFLLPFAATYANLMSDVHARSGALDKATMIGAIGLAAAVLINIIWCLDCNWGGRQLFGRSKDTAAKILICSLGFALWLTWTCVGIAMSMSYDQVNAQGIYN